MEDLRQTKDLTESASWSKRNLFVLFSYIDAQFLSSYLYHRAILSRVL